MKNRTFILSWTAWIWFYVGWYLCLQMAESGLSWQTLFIPMVSWVLLRFQMPVSRKLAAQLMVLMIIGLALDRTLHSLQFLEFKAEFQWGLVPIWLVSLWLMLGAALPFLEIQFRGHRKKILGILLAAIFAPISYKSGESFGLIVVPSPSGIVAIAVEWSLYFALCLWTLSPKVAHQKTTF